MNCPRITRAALSLLALLGACRREDPAPKAPPPPPVRHGIPLTGLRVQDTVLAPGATLASLVTAHGGTPSQVHALSEACRGVFELRHLRAGDSLSLLLDSATGRLRHLLLRPDPLHRIRMDLDSVPAVHRIDLKVDTVPRVVQGAIRTSLWEDLVSQGHSPSLVGRMADILAWQVDFFAVQPGDSFLVAYDEYRVDGKGVAQGPIHAVRFRQGEELAEDYRFVHGGREGYYDAQGRPAQRAFLRAPLQFSRISSHFSGARLHPVLRIVRPHFGVDYAAPEGTPVMAVGEGTVIQRGWGGGGGNTLKLRHDNGCVTGYLHLKGFAAGTAPGQRLRQGQTVGFVGSTGVATGPHLDFRFWMNGKPVDPLKVIPPPPPPMPADLLPAFAQERERIRARIASGDLPKPPAAR